MYSQRITPTLYSVYMCCLCLQRLFLIKGLMTVCRELPMASSRVFRNKSSWKSILKSLLKHGKREWYQPAVYYLNGLKQVLLNFFWKGPGSKYFLFWSHVVFDATTQLCCTVKPAIGKYANEWAWLYSNEPLFMGPEMWISCNFHALWNIIFLLAFFNHLQI